MTRAPSAKKKPSRFAARPPDHEVEAGSVFAPKFDRDGLISCVVTDVASGEVLMVAHMNDEALARTLERAEAWFYSRSRKALWRKGETSGHSIRVVEMRVDCDQDVLWIKVEQQRPGACHTGRRSCFYRVLPLGAPAGPQTRLTFRDAELVFDPREAYGDKGAGSGKI
jgi:phosphoribosyl-AMP cyclohydrolase